MRVFLLALIAAQPLACGAAPVDYDRDVAPVFRSYCAGCHNDRDYEGDFSLETYAGFRSGGEEGDPLAAANDGGDAFLLRLLEKRAKPHMPPKDKPQPPAEELALLKRWITEGAPGPATDTSILQRLVVPRISPSAPGTEPVAAACFAPGGGGFAIARGAGVELRATPDGPAVRHFEGARGKVNALHFSPDGTLLVAATGVPGLTGVAVLWEVANGAIRRTFGGHDDLLHDAEFSPDGTLLATAGYDRVIRIHDVSTGETLRALDVHKGAVFDLAWHPSGKVLASASADETVKLWRVSDGLRLDTLNQPQGEQNAVVFTPDGRHVIAAGADQRLHLWEFVSLETPALNPLRHARFAHDSAIVALSLVPDGRHLVSAAEDRSLKLWRIPDLTESHAFETQPDIAGVLIAASGGAAFLAGRMDGTLAEYALPGGGETPPPSPEPTAKSPPSSLPSDPHPFAEAEPNNEASEANTIVLPAEVKGAIGGAGDRDGFRFHAEAGQRLTLEVRAERDQSHLDAFLEVLDADGHPVEQAVLQATRDSWLTFRGKDSATSDDFRLQNWSEMELNEFLYCNGEVVKLWHYPRGPDSGFRVYPGRGERQTYFSTSPLSHALGQPCYTVVALPPGSSPAPNGLPVFRLNHENDDDPQRRFGKDSLLLFTAPRAGPFIARVRDRRGFGGAGNFHYTLSVRATRPDFSGVIGGRDAKVPGGGGAEFSIDLQRLEGFEGPVRIEIAGLPAGFSASSPLSVEAGQTQALGLLTAAVDAPDPDEAADRAIAVTATAVVDGLEVTKPLGDLGNLQLAPPPKMRVRVLAADGSEDPRLTIRPGETINARVRIDRGDYDGIIDFGNDASGRNLPHGVFVDNIGLNGLLLLEGQSERDFQITASRIAAPGARDFHLLTGSGGGAVSQRVTLEVLNPPSP